MVAAPATDEQRLAAQGDLRELIRLARERGELEVIKGANTYLEMGALYELSLRDRYPPLLLFEDIPNYPKSHKVLMNVRFSRIFQDDLSLEALKIIVLSGYLRRLGPRTLARYAGRILNIHPGPLPAFGGGGVAESLR